MARVHSMQQTLSWLIVTRRYSRADFMYSLYHSPSISLLSTYVVHLEVIAFLYEGIFILSPSAFKTNDIFGREWGCLVLPIYHRYVCFAIAYGKIYYCFHYTKIITQYPVPWAETAVQLQVYNLISSFVIHKDVNNTKWAMELSVLDSEQSDFRVFVFLKQMLEDNHCQSAEFDNLLMLCIIDICFTCILYCSFE